eukprot:CAMPEP_0185277112 /NCGR_PEP_ID=MMETSP1359-20130426/57860_1 /TAXON_ID=552665 /ORGANISM="Bigelowiella longifila, Strain CCMP242" /LENGTH=57 /DNA_ID=CAMNT_0027871097 /DNA_START=491 /DNA_END=660 /DNA_ORIENTATION=-
MAIQRAILLVGPLLDVRQAFVTPATPGRAVWAGLPVVFSLVLGQDLLAALGAFAPAV